MTRRPGWPAALRGRPVCPKRQLPIPFIAEVAPDGTGEFTIIDQDRKADCIRGRLCAMCGGRMGDLVTLIGDAVSLDPDTGFFIEPPVHEECGELALGGLCPFLSRERVPRRPVQDQVAVVGSDVALAAVGHTVAKRPVVMAVTRDYGLALVPAGNGSPVLVYRVAGPLVRVRRFAYQGGRLAEVTGAG